MPKYIHSGNFARRLCNFEAIDEHSANAVISLLYREPAADVAEVKHGHWIYHIDTLFPEDSKQECSVCHEEENMRSILNDNYCPNCGAMMDEERNKQNG